MMMPEVTNEDCMDFMRRYPDKYFDLAVVDPPYGIGQPKQSNLKGFRGRPSLEVRLEKNRLNTGGGKPKNRILNKSSIDWDNAIPDEEYFSELFRVSKNQIIWGGNYFDLPPTRCIVCWDKVQPWENFSQWEMAWTSFDYPAKMYRISNTGGANLDRKIHPTQKPVELYDRCFIDFTKPGMKILDTHLGSGSSRISAYKAGLDFWACEVDSSSFYDSDNRFIDFVSKYGIVPGKSESMSFDTQARLF